MAGCEAAWQVARAGGHAVLYEMRPVRSTPAHKTDGARRAGVQQLPQERAGKRRSVAAERRTAPLRIAVDQGDRAANAGARRPRPDGRSRPVRRRSYTRTRRGSRDRDPARRSCHPRSGAHLDHRQRTADLRRAGCGNRAADRIAAAILLRQHQSDCGRRIDRYVDRVRGVALRQIAGRDRRLSELPVRQGGVRGVPGRAAGCGERSGTHPKTTQEKITSNTSKPACRSKRSRGAGATRCASGR